MNTLEQAIKDFRFKKGLPVLDEDGMKKEVIRYHEWVKNHEK